MNKSEILNKIEELEKEVQKLREQFTKNYKRGEKLTITELYKWAVKNDAENLDIEIQYRDGGGYYCGRSNLCETDVEIVSEDGHKIVVL